jgi:hypothetical protein
MVAAVVEPVQTAPTVLQALPAHVVMLLPGVIFI